MYQYYSAPICHLLICPAQLSLWWANILFFLSFFQVLTPGLHCLSCPVLSAVSVLPCSCVLCLFRSANAFCVLSKYPLSSTVPFLLSLSQWPILSCLFFSCHLLYPYHQNQAHTAVSGGSGLADSVLGVPGLILESGRAGKTGADGDSHSWAESRNPLSTGQAMLPEWTTRCCKNKNTQFNVNKVILQF